MGWGEWVGSEWVGGSGLEVFVIIIFLWLLLYECGFCCGCDCCGCDCCGCDCCGCDCCGGSSDIVMVVVVVAVC